MDQSSGENQPVLPILAAVLQWFTDRLREQKHFEDMLEGRSRVLVLLVSGENGIGKTWLLRRLEQKVIDRKMPVVYLDLASRNQSDRLGMMQQCAAALGQEAFASYYRQLAEAIEVGVAKQKRRRASKVEIHAERDVQISHSQIVGGDLIQISGDNPELAKIWYEKLITAFFNDLARLGQKSGAVLLIDSYDLVLADTRLWIKDHLFKRLGEGQLPGVKIAAAGTEVPSFPAEWEGLVTRLTPPAFAAEEIRAYLKTRFHQEAADEFVEKVLRATNGLPYLVAMVADQPEILSQEVSPDRLVEMLVNELLERQDAGQIDPTALEMAALPGLYDSLYLSEMLGSTDVDGLVNRLAGLSFIETRPGRFYEITLPARRVFLKRWRQKPAALRDACQKAGAFFTQRAERELDPVLKADFEQEAAVLALETGDAQGFNQVRALIDRTIEERDLQNAEKLLQRAGGIDDLPRQARLWFEYYLAYLALENKDFARCQSGLQTVLEEAEPGSELCALAGWAQGLLENELLLWDASIEHARRSLAYFDSMGDTHRAAQVRLALGEIYLTQAQAVGSMIRPLVLKRGSLVDLLRAIPAWLISLPLILYGRLIRRWQFLPPLLFSMNYQNWTLAGLLFNAVFYFQAAEKAVGSSQDLLLFQARLGLAQAYSRLGWWELAQALFKTLNDMRIVQSNAYRLARLALIEAEVSLEAGRPVPDKTGLESGLRVFEKYTDRESQGRVKACLGQFALMQGEFEDGLQELQESLTLFDALGDTVNSGHVLALLRARMRMDGKEESTAGEARRTTDEVRRIISNEPVQTFFSRVTDHYAQVMEKLVSASLVGLAVGVIALFARIGLSPVAEVVAFLSRPWMIVSILGGILGAAWLVVLLLSLIGLPLVHLSARQPFPVDQLDRYVVTPEKITRLDYQGKEHSPLLWSEVQRMVVVERYAWKAVTRFFSYSQLEGRGKALRIPAGLDGYEDLRDCAAGYLARAEPPVRLTHASIHMLRSPLGVLFLLSPLFLILVRLVGWYTFGVIPQAGLAAWISGVSAVLGNVGVVAGPYRWAIYHPLKVRYLEDPASRAPFWMAGFGLAVMAGAFTLAAVEPFFAIRNLLNMAVFPVGFGLFVGAGVWVWFARARQAGPQESTARLYSQAVRWLAVGMTVVGLAASAWFVGRELVPFFFVYQAFAYYHREVYPETVQAAGIAAYLNPDLADVLTIRGLAYQKMGQYAESLPDLTRLVEASHMDIAHFRWYRAVSYHGMGRDDLACQDLDEAFKPGQVWVSEWLKTKAAADRQSWSCPR